MAAADIRSRSLAALERLSLPLPTHLPPIEAGVLVSRDAAIERLLSAHAVAAASYGFSRAKALAWIDAENLKSQLTDAERAFLSQDGEANVFQARVEAIWALAWALDLTPTLSPDMPCEASFSRMLPDLLTLQTSADLRGRAHLRDRLEIEEARDLYYCVHWAIRELELKRKTLPAGITPFAIEERRRALEWLLSASDWEEPDLDT